MILEIKIPSFGEGTPACSSPFSSATRFGSSGHKRFLSFLRKANARNSSVPEHSSARAPAESRTTATTTALSALDSDCRVVIVGIVLVVVGFVIVGIVLVVVGVVIVGIVLVVVGVVIVRIVLVVVGAGVVVVCVVEVVVSEYE